MRNGGYVVPYGDSPYDDEDVGEEVYLDILNRSQDYVHIMTPYLIIDEEMINALIFAAQRGVQVKPDPAAYPGQEICLSAGTDLLSAADQQWGGNL